MTQHTPGPWEWNQDSRWRNCLMAPQGASGPLSMVRVAQMAYVTDANARLIAGAPELLETLKRIEAWDKDAAGGPSENNLDWDLFDALMLEARTAIAKAEGSATP